MKQRNANASKLTIGIDLGDRWSHLCILNPAGDVVDRRRVATREVALRRELSSFSVSRVVLEAGVHSPWVSRLVNELGHEPLVANPRRVAMIYANESKSDRVDAEALARVGRFDPKLLSPIRHRDPANQSDRTRLASRDVLVRVRTALINHVRGSAKASGTRLSAASTARSFVRRAASELPGELREGLAPVLEMIDALSGRISGYDRSIRKRCEERSETAVLRQVTGVGALTALAFAACLEDPARFPRSRTVGAYLGLRPRKRQSGERDPQLGITKAGDEHVRRLLVSSAHYILGPFGPDCDLRRFGLRLVARGGAGAKPRAIIAVARKLAVLLHRLWATGEIYEPLRVAARAAA